MFLFRWYQEVDSNGKVLMDGDKVPTDQNKGRNGYYLPLDNGNFPFEWVSNMQVICAVHLKPFTTKNRTYQLPAPDKKTIVAAMKDM